MKKSDHDAILALALFFGLLRLVIKCALAFFLGLVLIKLMALFGVL